MENRFKFTREFLSDLQEEIGEGSTVSFSYGPNGFTMLVSFHDHPDVEDEEMLNVEFEDSDFQDSEVYEESVIEEVRNYVNENIYQ